MCLWRLQRHIVVVWDYTPNPPTVQVYRDGVPYGTAQSMASSFTFPTGSYLMFGALRCNLWSNTFVGNFVDGQGCNAGVDPYSGITATVCDAKFYTQVRATLVLPSPATACRSAEGQTCVHPVCTAWRALQALSAAEIAYLYAQGLPTGGMPPVPFLPPPPPQASPPPPPAGTMPSIASLIGHWTFDNDFQDSVGSMHGFAVNTPALGGGERRHTHTL